MYLHPIQSFVPGFVKTAMPLNYSGQNSLQDSEYQEHDGPAAYLAGFQCLVIGWESWDH